MLGSCCEIQEAREAHVRRVYRDATKISENRLFRNTRAAEDVRRSLYCSCEGICCDDCEDCDSPAEELEPEASAPGQAAGASESDDDDDFEDDPDERAMLDRMRQARLKQIQSESSAAQQAERDGLGCHRKVGEQELARLLQEPEPLVVHAADPGDDLCELIESELRQAAVRCKDARHLTVNCAAGKAPRCLRVEFAVPALLLVERGEVAATAPVLDELREPGRLQAVVSSWLENIHRDITRRKRMESDDSDEEEEAIEAASYCGRPGCRTYAHEHLGWGDIPK